jgi:hypothetical protein
MGLKPWDHHGVAVPLCVLQLIYMILQHSTFEKNWGVKPPNPLLGVKTLILQLRDDKNCRTAYSVQSFVGSEFFKRLSSHFI